MLKILRALRNVEGFVKAAGAVVTAAIVAVETYQALKEKSKTERTA